MSEHLRVSTIITCHNGEEFVAEAIASIRRQSCPVDEIVIIDDGSTDGSAAVVDSLAGDDLRYFHQENRGLPNARNAGLKRSTGDVITFLDYDDLWSDEKTTLQIALLKAQPQVGVVVGYAQIMSISRGGTGLPAFEPWSEPAPALSMNGAAIRRSVFDAIGGFDPQQLHCDDWDWYMRARERGVQIRMHDDVVHYYRRHERNMTNDVARGNQQTLLMLKKSLIRRRAQQGGQARNLPSLLKQGG